MNKLMPRFYTRSAGPGPERTCTTIEYLVAGITATRDDFNEPLSMYLHSVHVVGILSASLAAQQIRTRQSLIVLGEHKNFWFLKFRSFCGFSGLSGFCLKLNREGWQYILFSPVKRKTHSSRTQAKNNSNNNTRLGN